MKTISIIFSIFATVILLFNIIDNYFISKVSNSKYIPKNPKKQAILDMANEDMPTMLLKHEDYFKDINNLKFE